VADRVGQCGWEPVTGTPASRFRRSNCVKKASSGSKSVSSVGEDPNASAGAEIRVETDIFLRDLRVACDADEGLVLSVDLDLIRGGVCGATILGTTAVSGVKLTPRVAPTATPTFGGANGSRRFQKSSVRWEGVEGGAATDAGTVV
jgi:hypothetical protein